MNDTFGAAFKASESYKQIKTITTSSKLVYIITVSKCSLYRVNFDSNIKPKLSDDFIQGLKSLSNKYDAYYKFFDTYGTHYVSDLVMGAQYGFNSTLT
jgi:hypothetical protein